MTANSDSWLSVISAIAASMSPLEIAAVGFGVLYLVLAIRQNILCWPAALIGVLLSLVLFYRARLYMEAALQIFYAAMAIYGWHQWSGKQEIGGWHRFRRFRGGAKKLLTSELPIGVWSVRQHALAIGATLAGSAVVGRVLSETDAAFPYVDSFTSIAAVVTTYMVAKKILENWIYWLVIDSIGVYLYAARELYLYAALFVFYLVLVVIGFVRWWRDWRAQGVHAVA